MRAAIAPILLFLIGVVVAYEYVYKDFRFKQEAMERRAYLMNVLSPIKERLAKMEPKIQACYQDSDNLEEEQRAQCKKLLGEYSKLGTKAKETEVVLAQLSAVVHLKYNGAPPSWW